jgi:hypothetical protein
MSSNHIVVHYPNRTEQIIDTIFNDLMPSENEAPAPQLIDLVGI